MDYVALFPAGTADLVVEGLRNLLPGVKIFEPDESALRFFTPAPLRSADTVPFAKNLFVVSGRTARRNLDASVAGLAKRAGDLRRPSGSTGFRVMCHIDGQLAACSPQARQRLESAISAATGLRPEPRGRCHEYWVIGRRNWPEVYLAKRLPLGQARRPAMKGALSGELSALLVSLSQPDHRDVFIDPFAGSGSIVAARLAYPARQVIYNDIDKSVRHPVRVQPERSPELVMLHEDGTAMTTVKPGAVSAIVTDPPWGEYGESIGDYPAFTRSLAAEFGRLLNPRWGRLVVLVGRRREQLMQVALTEQGFTCDPPIEILVNGHPASVIRAYPRKL